MPLQSWVLCTNAIGGDDSAHAYEFSDKASAQTAGEKLRDKFDANPNNTFSEFTFSVLPLETLETPESP